MRLNRLRILITLILCGSVFTAFAALDLVRGGLATLTVDIGSEAEGPEQLAAAEYQRIMRKVTGSDDVVEASGKLYIGTPETHPVIAAAAGRLGLGRPALQKRGAFVLRQNGKDIYAAANHSLGAMHGVFELLEQIGVRWFFPSEEGEFMPPRGAPMRISWSNDELVSVPDFEIREINAHYNRDRFYFLNHLKLLASSPEPKRFSQKGFFRRYGGHSFGSVTPADCKNRREYFERYPEQFAWNERDQRRIDTQHCYTSAATRKTFLGWIDRFWQKNPDFEGGLSLVPLDYPHYCQCPECSKAPDPSTLVHGFITDLINESEKKHPGRLYFTLAYSIYWPPPKIESLPQNQMFGYCMRYCCYLHKIDDPDCDYNRRHLEELAQWRKLLPETTGIRGYELIAFDDVLYTPMAPVLATHLRHYKKLGLPRYSSECYGNFIPTQAWEEQPLFVNRYTIYALAKLAWDTSRDENLILRDFCRYNYGAGAFEMERYHRLFQQAWMRQRVDPLHLTLYHKKFGRYVDGILDSGTVKEIDGLFELALAKTKNTPREQRLVELDRKAWRVWRDTWLARRTWGKVAAGDIDRKEQLRKTQPTELLFGLDLDKAAPGKEGTQHPELADGCLVHSEETDGAVRKYVAVRKSQRSQRMFTNHPRIFKGSFDWVNYETKFQFRFSSKEQRRNPVLRMRLREAGARFLDDDYRYFRVTVAPEQVSTQLVKHDSETGKLNYVEISSQKLMDSGIENLELDKWYSIAARLIDGHCIVTIDGREVLDSQATLGGGYANLEISPVDIRDFTIHKIDD